MLNDLQVRSVRLLTNNPDKIEKVEALDIVVTQRAPLPADVTPENEVYLRTKVERMRHLLDLGEPPAVQADSLPIMTPMGQKQNGRPFVTLCFAQSLDGSIAIKRGQFTAISGAASMKMTHRLRAAHHALLIGIGTALADDPQMTVRLVEGRQPQPVILDSMLRLPETAVVFQHPRPPWILPHLRPARSASKPWRPGERRCSGVAHGGGHGLAAGRVNDAGAARRRQCDGGRGRPHHHQLFSGAVGRPPGCHCCAQAAGRLKRHRIC
ncbi:MAG: dihydrofolate reductase family protein [Chloroflexi bacterium]|nr:dihydrofolate reductase family protein [Chloroflexota bacterium]